MTELVDKLTINSTSDRIWDVLVFFFQSNENYKLWHKDHISCYWKRGKDFLPGSILIAEEYIHGAKHKLGFKIINNIKDHILEYKMIFPFSIICSGGQFKLIAKGSETVFMAQLNFRFGFLLKALFKNRIEALRIHMKEEGLCIKNIIENIRK